MTSAKPTYWTICLEYLREAYQARERGEDWTSSHELEQRLGLSDFDSMAYVQHLQQSGLIEIFPAMGNATLYRLTPEGQRHMEEPASRTVPDREAEPDIEIEDRRRIGFV